MPPEPRPDSADTCLPCDGETIIAIGSDDSDEEVASDNVVYTLLGQQEPMDDESSDEDEDSYSEEQPASGSEDLNISAAESQSGTLPPAPRASGSEEIAAVWNSQPVSSSSLDLNAERSAQIQAAMAGFTLPPSAVPAWAANVPEEQWKQGLLERLQRGTLHSFKNGAGCSTKNI